ncbi:MAG: fatty acid desaturase [Acidimicrobiaceae bacterium]|nr:fatty acid desaturase [Acidimicrobiaceae bacterium]
MKIRTSAPRLGGMVRTHSPRRTIDPAGRIKIDGHPKSEWRTDLRKINNFRNSVTIVLFYLQTATIIFVTTQLNNLAIYFVAILLMGRAHAQAASLMHEAAHRMLFSNRKINDFVGRWLLGYIAFTNTDGYRHVHMAHHRQEFGPDEPDIPLYANYPISRASFRRKILRDISGISGLRLARLQLASLSSPDTQTRRAQRRILVIQVLLAVLSVATGNWTIYFVLWLLPYLTIWRVINRLRSIAEHGGLRADEDRRITTHAVRQHPFARFLLVPYNIGWHLAHHVDAGIPFRSLPKYHSELERSGFVDDEDQYPNYFSLWRALRTSTV